MNVIITGASGMVGKGVLLECLDDQRILSVLSIGRSALDVEHKKLKHLVHPDFSDFSGLENSLQNYDAAYLCMGISVAGLNEPEYQRVTYDYTMSLASVLTKSNPRMTCTYVSGAGTDSSEKGNVMWARVKGKTENALLNAGFKQAFMFRPGAIIPLKGIKSKTKLYQFIYDYFLWLVKLVKLIAPSSVVNTTQIGRAMINLSLKGYDKPILEPKDILEASK